MVAAIDCSTRLLYAVTLNKTEGRMGNKRPESVGRLPLYENGIVFTCEVHYNYHIIVVKR